MSYLTRSVMLTTLIICFYTPVCAQSGTDILQDLPEWLRSYPSANLKVEYSIKHEHYLSVSFAFGTNDSPERVADFYQQKLSAAGLKATTAVTRTSDSLEIEIRGSSDQNPRVNIRALAAASQIASSPELGKHTKVHVDYENDTPDGNQWIGWDVLWPLIIVLVICVPILLFWLWMLIECMTKESNEGNTKVVWLAIILFTQFVGALLYFFYQEAATKGGTGEIEFRTEFKT
jgi:hypothetical protein